MGQGVDVMDVMGLTTYMLLIAAAALAGLGLFVFSRNHKAAVNRLFAAGMLGLAAVDLGWFGFVRGEDTMLLARFFLEQMSHEMARRRRRFSSAAEAAIRTYAWPGNVREPTDSSCPPGPAGFQQPRSP